MNGLLCALALGGAVITTASPATADTFLPAGASTITFQGVVTTMGLMGWIDCDATIVVVTTPLDGSGQNQAYIHSFALGGGGLCGLMSSWNDSNAIFVSAPTTPVGAPATKLVFEDMAHFGFPACGPDDLEVDWLPGSPPRIGLTPSSFPGACKFDGELTQVATPWMTITN